MLKIDHRDPAGAATELRRTEPRERRGNLRIFFGASVGVGKTYKMLECARDARAAGKLAHSNVLEGEPRPRHAKRWQDIEELLAAGIDVWTTLNVQHLESLNDVVAGITGVRQKDTVPDRIFDAAAEVRLIDLSPDELQARSRAGKVHGHFRAGTTAEKLFREPNLFALREMALRRTADRVDAAARQYAANEAASRPWLARDRFLIAIAPDDQAEQLIRVGKRFADALDAEWLVVSVETPSMLKLGEQARNRRIKALRLAESLGAQTVTLDGPSASAALIEYARLRKITRIVLGAPRRTGVRALLRPSTATKLVRTGGGFDISVIARRDPPQKGREPEEPVRPSEIHWRCYWATLGISLACTALAALMYPYFAPADLVMVYLLGATIAALRFGRGPASLSAVANMLLFDFFFVEPRYSLAVANFQYVITLAVMLVVALIIANLGASVRAQTRVAGARERRTTLLYGMTRELMAGRSLEDLALVAVKHISEAFDGRAVVLVPDSTKRLNLPKGAAQPGSLMGSDLAIAQWVFDNGEPAGLGTDTLPAAPAQYVPLKAGHNILGVLAVAPRQPRRLLLPEQRHFLETFAAQIALALERTVFKADPGPPEHEVATVK